MQELNAAADGSVKDDIERAIRTPAANKTDKKLGSEKVLAYLAVEEERSASVVGSSTKKKPRYIVFTTDEDTHVLYLHRFKYDKTGMIIVKSWPLFELQSVTVDGELDLSFTINKSHLFHCRNARERNIFVYTIARNYMFYMSKPLKVITPSGKKVEWAYRNVFNLEATLSANAAASASSAAAAPSSKAEQSATEEGSSKVQVSSIEEPAYVPTPKKPSMEYAAVTNLEDEAPLPIAPSPSVKSSTGQEPFESAADAAHDTTIPTSDRTEDLVRLSSPIEETLPPVRVPVPPPVRRSFDTGASSGESTPKLNSEKFKLEKTSLFPASLPKSAKRFETPKTPNQRTAAWHKSRPNAPDALTTPNSTSIESPHYDTPAQRLPSSRSSAELPSPHRPHLTFASSAQSSPLSAKQADRDSVKHDSRPSSVGIGSAPLILPKNPTRKLSVRRPPSLSAHTQQEATSQAGPAGPDSSSSFYTPVETSDKPSSLNYSAQNKQGIEPHFQSTQTLEHLYNAKSRITLDTLPVNAGKHLFELDWSGEDAFEKNQQELLNSLNESMRENVEELFRQKMQAKEVQDILNDSIAGCDTLFSTLNLYSMSLSGVLGDVINMEQQQAKQS
ncbi:hypothetical protein SJAG_02166 [Schizosaccharomyces japonicus yFS275]|uniref:Exocyst complex component Sec3 PIP2-binding N-terminal domain-containing protein n=1 Tax=Schizosaccharomyces japonicus (strain yFS275 / FY16936) TaxID=402676 RepID=B6K1Q5_SCHJY|nr:hypothetical protein SJAG_02166 [Schizosaccharomyces japonicus yFS275]EEB07086.1 hypothetical protein SJAG_02166 [Schizosaccharomyces japonicus yFS275]